MKPETQAALDELGRRDVARTHLAAYAEYACDVVPADHHALVCTEIDNLLNDEYDELIILAPPGSAKSTYTSIALSSYFMGRYPKGQILTCSYSTELAEKWGRRVRNQITSDAHQALFPDCELSKDSQSAGRWATTLNGEFYAAGVGSGILGFRADLAVIDDPISGFEQAQSIAQLAKVHAWYETDLITRMKPKAKLVLICQRLARNDLAGYLIDRNKTTPTRRQKVLTLKMEAEEGDVLGRSPGERLWPEWFTKEMVTDAKRDEFKWRTLYQQEPPSDTGEWATPEEVQIISASQVPARTKKYLLTDLALSINSGDYTVHMVADVDMNLNVYITEAWRRRTSPEKVVDKQLELCTTYDFVECLIDDDNSAKVYMPLLGREAKDKGVSVNWKPLPLRGQDKETRAAPIRGWFKRGKIFIVQAPWTKWLVTEILMFPNALGDGVDDGMDCLSLLGRRLHVLSSPNALKPKPKPLAPNTYTLNELFAERELHLTYDRRI